MHASNESLVGVAHGGSDPCRHQEAAPDSHAENVHIQVMAAVPAKSAERVPLPANTNTGVEFPTLT